MENASQEIYNPLGNQKIQPTKNTGNSAVFQKNFEEKGFSLSQKEPNMIASSYLLEKTEYKLDQSAEK